MFHQTLSILEMISVVHPVMKGVGGPLLLLELTILLKMKSKSMNGLKSMIGRKTTTGTSQCIPMVLLRPVVRNATAVKYFYLRAEKNLTRADSFTRLRVSVERTTNSPSGAMASW